LLDPNSVSDGTSDETSEAGRNYYKYAYITFGIFTIVAIISILCLCKKINICIRIMECAADFITECCTVLIVPPIISLLVLLWTLFWSYGAIYLYSSGDWEKIES